MNGHNICHWCIIAISVQIFDFPAAQPIPNGNNKEPPPVAPKPSREKRSSVDGLLDMLEGTVPDTPNENYRRYVCHTTPPPIKTTLPYIIQCYTITRLQTVASGTHTTELGPSVCLCYFMNPPAPLQCITTTSLPLWLLITITP